MHANFWLEVTVKTNMAQFTGIKPVQNEAAQVCCFYDQMVYTKKLEPKWIIVCLTLLPMG